MKFSVVTISFNQAEYLEKTIESVLSQNGVDLEYIVVDAGSTDGSRDIIRRYSDRIDHVILEPDGGPADGLNKGFQFASGDWFGYINSDDFYLPGGLRLAARAVREHPTAGAVVGDGFLVDGSGNSIRKSISTRFGLTRALHGACFSLQQATFYRRDVFKVVGGFNILNGTCWDGEILVEIARRGFEVRRFNGDVGAFRIHPTSITGSGRLSQQYADDVNRIFRNVSGRDRSYWDRAAPGPALRAWNRSIDPMRSFRLFKDRVSRTLARS